MTKKQRAKREELLKEQRAIKKSLNDMGKLSSLRQPTYRRETQFIPSHGNGIGNAVAKERPEYTGDAMLGIGQLHKSNAVPVFKQEEAEELARMRR
jgi:hypothetical protein